MNKLLKFLNKFYEDKFLNRIYEGTLVTFEGTYNPWGGFSSRNECDPECGTIGMIISSCYPERIITKYTSHVIAFFDGEIREFCMSDLRVFDES